MKYTVKKPILGFEDVLEVELEEIENIFCTLKPADKEYPKFTLINPYQFKEYSFDIPKDVQILLDIKEDSHILAYNVVVLHNPITESQINFQAPLIFNKDNKTMAQFTITHEGLYTIDELLKLKNGAE